MFSKKNHENLIYFFSFIFIIFFYLYSKNSLFSHWSDILDQDVTLIYNSILIGSNTPQQYLDHPAFTTFFILNIFYKIGYLLNIIEIKNLEELLNHTNKDGVLQSIHNVSQFVHLLYSLILISLFKKILNIILNDNLSSFFLSLIFLFSPAFIFLFDIIRSEILSIIFLFLFYICLENTFKKNLLYIILAGIFFVCALLAKIQIIICIFPILIIFVINNYNLKNNNKIYVSKLTKIIINILLIIFIIAIIDNFFYKRVDKIFFLFILICFIFAFSISEKKLTFQNNANIFLFLFFVGCSASIIFFKFISNLSIASFHPALVDIITSPISQMSYISTAYEIGRSDNFEFFHKIKDFFFSARRGWGIETVAFLFDKFNIFTYLLSFLFLVYFFKKKEYLKTTLVFFLISSIVSIILVFNFRPYIFYDIYILPFNLLLISILIQNIQFKKTLTFGIFIIYIIFNISNISARLEQKRLSGILNYKVNLDSNMKNICTEEQILNKNSYMRYWQREYTADFLKDLCKSYFKSINQ